MRDKESCCAPQEVKDHIIHMDEVEFLSPLADQKDARHCPYHRMKGHTLEQCVICRRISVEKHKVGEILL